MKRIIALLTAVTLLVLCAAPVLAAGLGISPPTVEFDVLANGSTEVEFLVYGFTGDLEISLEDIPLKVEPTLVSVAEEEEGTRIVLVFYGDSSLGSQVYEGKIRFLAKTGGTVAMGIKVRATVNHLSPRQPPVEEEEEEVVESTLPEETPEDSEDITWTDRVLPYDLDPTVLEDKPFPVIPVAGIAAGTLVVMTLIIVIARRYQY